jgi:hypothetical protein
LRYSAALVAAIPLDISANQNHIQDTESREHSSPLNSSPRIEIYRRIKGSLNICFTRCESIIGLNGSVIRGRVSIQLHNKVDGPRSIAIKLTQLASFGPSTTEVYPQAIVRIAGQAPENVLAVKICNVGDDSLSPTILYLDDRTAEWLVLAVGD